MKRLLEGCICTLAYDFIATHVLEFKYFEDKNNEQSHA